MKLAWINRKRIYKRKKKHHKSKRNDNLHQNNIAKSFDINKYTIYNLTEDIQNTIINYLSETSMVYLNNNVLQIIGKDDFGSNTKIIIYVLSYDGNYFKYYDGKKKGYINININNRLKI